MNNKDIGADSCGLFEVKRFGPFFHEAPFYKLLEHKVAYMNIQGAMITGPDRRFDYTDELGQRQLWIAWQKDIQAASRSTEYKVPQEVMNDFQATKHLSRPPRKGDKNIQMNGPIEDALIIEVAVTPPVTTAATPAATPAVGLVSADATRGVPEGFKPPRFSWSYTALADFESCPLSFAEKRYFKTIKFQETPETREGNEVHSGLEHYLKARTKTDKIAPYLRFADMIIAASEGGELLVENELCINEGLGITGWFSGDAWGRAKKKRLTV